MKKSKLAAALLALVMMLSTAGCTEEGVTSGSESKTDTSSSIADSSEVSTSASQTTTESTTTTEETTISETTTEQTTTTTEETTTTKQTTTTKETTTTKQTTKAAPKDEFSAEIKADVESCRSGSAVDLFKLIEKWDIHPSQMGLGGPNGRFTMQLRRNAADTAYEGFVISAEGETNQSFNILFGKKAEQYPVYDCKYFDENVRLTGYDFVALYRVAKYNDYSLCGTEPYVNMSIDMGQ